MSLMSPGPGGAALLGGMQLGLQARRLRQSADAARQEGAAGALREKRLGDDAFQADVAHLVERFATAVPGDEGLLSYEYDAARQAHPDRKLPSYETLAALVGQGGFGNRADQGKYFDSVQAGRVQGMDGEVQGWLADVPLEQLLSPEGYAAAEAELRGAAKRSGVDAKRLEVYVRELEGRRRVAESQVASASRLTRDRTNYLNSQMRVIRNRAAMAYPAQTSGSFFGGSPSSRMDPARQAEFNIIVGRGESILREALQQGVMLTAEQAIEQMRGEFQDNPSLSKALTNVLTGPDGSEYVPAPAAFTPPLGRPLPAGVGAPAPAQQPAAGQPPAAETATVVAVKRNAATGESAYVVQLSSGETVTINQAGYDELFGKEPK